MAYATLATYDDVLKYFYLPAIQESLNHDTFLKDKLEANETDISGKDAKIEIHKGRSTGTGSRADGGALPTATYQEYTLATVPMKYHYGTIRLTGPNIAATRDSRGAYIKALDSEVKGIVRDLSKEINRQLWGCGYSVLGRWYSGGTTSMIVQKKYTGNAAGVTNGFGSTFGGKYVKERGDAVPITLSSMSSSSSASFTVEADSYAVTAVTEGTAYDTLTLSELSVSEAAGTFMARPAGLGAYAASGAHRYEMMGLRGIVTNEDLDEIAMNDGTDTGGQYNDPLQSVAVSGNSFWQAIVNAHSSGRYGGQRALTLRLMQTMFDDVEEAAGKDYGPDAIITTRALRREYLERCRADRIQVNTMSLDGGWKALDYNGVPFLVDSDAIDGEIYFLTLKDLSVYRMSDFDWMNKDGAVLARVSGYDAYTAVLFRYAELGCTSRNFQGVLCDLAYQL